MPRNRSPNGIGLLLTTEFICIVFRYVSFKKELKEHLLKADNLALTTDLWKNQTNEYIEGTFYYFDFERGY